jgi:predicted DNA-binding ribbon-helix-helix protein
MNKKANCNDLEPCDELDRGPKSTLISRNITVQGRRTSVRLEPEMWAALREISKREACSPHDVCSLISMRKKENTSLTAAIRVFLMLYFRAASTEAGHINAGHGSFETMLRRARLPAVMPYQYTRSEEAQVSITH